MLLDHKEYLHKELKGIIANNNQCWASYFQNVIHNILLVTVI